MSSLSLRAMKQFLGKSINNKNNNNKLNGFLAEVDLRRYITAIGYGDNISPGGWIARSEGEGTFGHNTIAFFPEILIPKTKYKDDRELPPPPHALHTVCATFHQIGIKSYYCVPSIIEKDVPTSVKWHHKQLGVPHDTPYTDFPPQFECFNQRKISYNHLRYSQVVAKIPSTNIPELFAQESVRIAFARNYLCEISDIDSLFWGQRYTYPIEVKEKTPAWDPRLGYYFGLDIHPFAKLAFYAARKGNLHSLFIVREIANEESRELVKWWAITFEQLAQFVSWNPVSGGKSMTGRTSSTVRIPRAEFSELDASYLKSL